MNPRLRKRCADLMVRKHFDRSLADSSSDWDKCEGTIGHTSVWVEANVTFGSENHEQRTMCSTYVAGNRVRLDRNPANGTIHSARLGSLNEFIHGIIDDAN